LIAPLALSAALALGLAPAAEAATALPSAAETITYDAGLRGTQTRPLVGEALTGTMKLNVTPDGTIQGTYLPLDGSPMMVSGGLQRDGTVWLNFGQLTVMGRWHNGGIVGSTFGPPSFDRLQFVAEPTNVQHVQQRG
jgi:hypothetical protein